MLGAPLFFVPKDAATLLREIQGTLAQRALVEAQYARWLEQCPRARLPASAVAGAPEYAVSATVGGVSSETVSPEAVALVMGRPVDCADEAGVAAAAVVAGSRAMLAAHGGTGGQKGKVDGPWE